jgi:hypothetical protein
MQHALGNGLDDLGRYSIRCLSILKSRGRVVNLHVRHAQVDLIAPRLLARMSVVGRPLPEAENEN